MMKVPQPRSKLYTTTYAYIKGILGLLFDGGENRSKVKNLEKELAIFTDSNVIAVPMARMGIYLILKNLISPGQYVVMSPYTITDVVNMVLCAGGVPLFVDIEAGGTFNIDINQVIKILEEESNIGAVLVTHYYGCVCDISPIIDMCSRKKIHIVEDAAQAFGAYYDSKPIGSLANAGVFSFGLLKHITGFLGGVVITKDKNLERLIRADVDRFKFSYRKMLLKKIINGSAFDFATASINFNTWVYRLFRFAYLNNISFFNNKLDKDSNPLAYEKIPDSYQFKMSNAQAAIICSQLSTMDNKIQKRISKAKIYHDGLVGLSNIVIPPMREDGSHIYLYYVIQCEQRDKLAKYLTLNFRDVQISHHRNCASLSCFSDYSMDCPNAELAAKNAIYLPCYPEYSDDQIFKNISLIKSFFEGAPI